MRWVLLVGVLSACGGGGQPSEPLEPTPVAAEPAADQVETGADEQADGAEAKQLGAIEKAIGERGPGVYQCRSLAAADDLKVDGEVQLSLVLGPDSKVKEVRVGSDSVGDAVLLECLKKLWQGYAFDAQFADGDEVALPPFRFVSEGAQYTVNAAHVPPKEAKDGRVTTKSVLTLKNTGNSAAELDLMTLAEGETSSQHMIQHTHVIFVASGGGSVKAARKRPIKVGAGDAIYVKPGTGYSFADGKDGEPTSLMRFRVRGAANRRAGLLVRTAGKAERLSIAGGKGQIDLYFDRAVVRDSAAYLGRLEAKPGLVVPEHIHDGSSEYLFVLAGEGRMTVEGKAFPVAAGDGIQIPPNTKHSFETTGDKPLEALQLYTPSGPEQRFRKK